MSIRYEDPWLTIHGGDCRDVLATLPDASVHCVVTSPPYWGLRDYGTASWDGGDPSCDHQVGTFDAKRGDRERYSGHDKRPGRECGKCGAVRQDRQLGLEATPEEYVDHLVAVFREVRRVLRPDGTLWLNLGDSYAGGGTIGRNDDESMPRPKGGHRVGSASPGAQGTRPPVVGLKPKDLVGIPWRVAFALQADGWYLRSDIIWAKPNPMPESVTDRPTKAHEYLFLLTKSPRYWYDADAVREAVSPLTVEVHGRYDQQTDRHKHADQFGHKGTLSVNGRDRDLSSGRNRRSVWTVATQPYPGAHFAVMPEALVEPCVKAGTSERGVCPTCGAPWERVVERERHIDPRPMTTGAAKKEALGDMARTTPQGRTAGNVSVTTTGWRPTCDHGGEPVPATCLDPFGGSGTVAVVAQRHRRKAVLVELNPEYAEQSVARASRSWGKGGRVRRAPRPTPEGSWLEEVS